MRRSALVRCSAFRSHSRRPHSLPLASSRFTRTLVGFNAGLTTGLATVLAVNPGARARSGTYAEFLAAFRPVDAVMRRVAPPLFLSTTASGVTSAAATARTDPLGATLHLASAALVAAAIRSTVTVNQPLNEQIRSWDDDVEPDDWRDVRARWDRGHHVRTALVGAAAVAALAASPTIRGWLDP